MSSQKQKLLAAAIDFRTNYSGYAFSFKYEYEKNPTNVSSSRVWNSGNLMTLTQPTCVLCNPKREFDSFGYEAENKYSALAEDQEHHNWYFFRPVKLMLQYKQVNMGFELEDEKGLKMPAIKVFAMAISYWKDHLLNTLEKQGIGLSVNDIHWVLPVPTTWTVSAKNFLREAAKEIEIEIEIEDDKGLKMRATTVLEMAIRYLQEHLLYTIYYYRRLSVTVEDLHWILTVPAIWTESAKDIIRYAAWMAGIDLRNLTIALELEAAAMYCQMLPSDQLSSKERFDDKKYIVVNLGDETADIAVHEKREDGTINEVYKASSGTCGGTQVNAQFIQMIIAIIGARVFIKFCERNKAEFLEMCREFEASQRSVHTDRNEKITIKVSIALKEEFEKERGKTIKDAVEQTLYQGKIQFTSDKMRLDAELFKSLFQNYIRKITEYLDDLLETREARGISTLLTVGKFSEYQIIQAGIMRAFPNLKVVIPIDGSSAVLYGAVILGHKLGISCDYNFPMFNDSSRALPYEIRRMDEQSQNLYREALSAGTERMYNIRVMIVGHVGVGKTALTKRLMNEDVRESEREFTEGIEIHATRCQIDHETKEWIGRKEDVPDLNTRRIADVLIKHSERAINQMKESSSSPKKEDRKSYKDKVALKAGPVSVASKPNSITNWGSQLNMGSSYNGKKQTQLKRQTLRAESGHNETNHKETKRIEIKKSSSLSTNTNLDGNNFEELEKIVKMEPFLTPSGKNVSYVTVLDFAGQFLFYTTHQAFMSWRTIYLLVTDIRLTLTDSVEEDLSGTALSGNKTRNVQEYVSYWLNSVHSHVKKGDSYPQNVILVATHTDKIPKETIAKQKELHFEAIRRNLSNSVLRCHLADEDFAISNIGFDPSIEGLKQKIFELAQKQQYWGELVPARWFPLEQVLLEKKSENVPILDYTEVEKLNQSRQVKIDKAEELVLFLQFEHDVGNIVFFFTEKLRRKVVLDPQWLIRGVTTLITSDQVIKKYPDLLAQWYQFKDTGRLTRNLIDSLWSHHAEFHDNKEHLLGVLEQLSIIAKPLEKAKQSEEEYYWVPCMVHTKAPENIQTLEDEEGVTKTSILCFESKPKFIHVGVFHRLLASCLSKWMPAKSGKKHLVFIGMCILQLDNCHNLMVSLNDFVIQATVMRYTCKMEKPDLSLCIEVKEYLHSSITEISKYLCPNSEYKLCIMCRTSAPESDGDRHELDFLRANKGKEIRCNSHKHTHRSSEELLGYWEKCPDNVGKSRRYGNLASERYLNNVAGKLGKEWHSIALQLGLSQTEIEQIEMSHPGNVRYQIFTALWKWSHRSRKDDSGKVRELVDALNEVKRYDLAEELKMDLSDITETSPEGNVSVSKKRVSSTCILS